MTVAKFFELANKLIYMNAAELTEHLRNPETPVLELMVGNVLVKASIFGDPKRLGFVLDRLIGKVATEVNVNGSVQVSHQNLIEALEQIDRDDDVL